MINTAERIALDHLSYKMEDSAFNVGKAIILHPRNDRTGGYQAVGIGILISLRKKGFVTRLPELRAWRITKAGREVLYHSRDEKPE